MDEEIKVCEKCVEKDSTSTETCGCECHNNTNTMPTMEEDAKQLADFFDKQPNLRGETFEDAVASGEVICGKPINGDFNNRCRGEIQIKSGSSDFFCKKCGEENGGLLTNI